VEQSGSILEKRLTIVNRLGLHARAAAKFAGTSLRFSAKITVTKDSTTVNGSSIMGLLLLGAQMGQSIIIRAKGADAGQAMTALQDLIERRFDEED